MSSDEPHQEGRTTQHTSFTLATKSVTTWIAVFAGLSGVVGSTVLAFYSNREQRAQVEVVRDLEARKELELLQRRAQEQIERSQEQTLIIEKELQQTKEELERISAQALAPNGVRSAELVKQLASMRATVEKGDDRMGTLEKQTSAVDQRMAKLEAVILAEPQKALELPLLKRDLQAFQQQFDHDLNGVKAENERVYDLMKWLVGLMALVSLSLVGAAISNVFKREQPAGTHASVP